MTYLKCWKKKNLSRILFYCCFSILPLLLVFNILIIMCASVDLWVYPTWNLWNFLDIQTQAFHQIWEAVCCYFFRYYFCPLLYLFSAGTPVMHMLVYLIVSHRSLRLCSFFFILFPFCSSDLIIPIDLYSSLQILSSPNLYFRMCTFQLQKIFSFSTFLEYFSTPKNPILFLFMFSIFLLIFSSWRNIVILFTSTSFSMISFSSLNIFKTYNLNKVSINSNLWASSQIERFLLISFLTMNGSCFLLFVDAS